MTSTPPVGESEQDNSSSMNNLSSLQAEKGTGTADEEFETSSIEALNWSEADEEELQQQQSAVTPPEKSIKALSLQGLISLKDKDDADGERLMKVDVKGSSSSGNVLSTSLLESMSTTVDGDENSKKSVIENWASDVKEAVDRGEMELDDESSTENEDESMVDTGNNENTGMRKRIKLSKKQNPMSDSLATIDTSADPLSNAPVLDEGPIWNKGPKQYRFRENRRINQKLTFGVLFAVVLAIGLGLGNLVAYNECETEYKSTTAKPLHPPSDAPVDSTDSSSPVDNPSVKPVPEQNKLEDPKMDAAKAVPVKPKEDPIVDQRYTMHMETLTRIVSKLDHLQQKIDKFENTTRQLGGVIMLKDKEDDEDEIDEEIVDSIPTKLNQQSNKDSLLTDEEVHEDIKGQDNGQSNSFVDDDGLNDDEIDYKAEYKRAEREELLNLIDGIEEAVSYLRMEAATKKSYLLDKERAENGYYASRSNLFTSNMPTEEDKELQLKIDASNYAIKKQDLDFIRQERKELDAQKILGLAVERTADDYSAEEVEKVKQKYRLFMKAYPLKQLLESTVERLRKGEKSVDLMLSLVDVEEHDDMFDFFDFLATEDFADSDSEKWGRDLSGMTMEELYPEESSGNPVHENPVKEVRDSVSSQYSLIVEPKKEVTVTPAVVDTTVVDIRDNVKTEETASKGPPTTTTSDSNLLEENVVNAKVPKRKREKSPKREINNNDSMGPKEKKQKRGKTVKRQDAVDFENMPSSSRYNSKENGNYDHEKKKYSRDKSYKKKQYKNSGENTHQQEYKTTKYSNDYDYDDDDQKRKRFSESNRDTYESRDYNYNQKAANSDWLTERAKAREDNRGDTFEFNQYDSMKKAKNWQMERDRAREKIRGKNHKNKSYED